MIFNRYLIAAAIQSLMFYIALENVFGIHCVKIYQQFIVFDDVRDESSIRPLHYDVNIM